MRQTVVTLTQAEHEIIIKALFAHDANGRLDYPCCKAVRELHTKLSDPFFVEVE